jgi:murein tripeptide amidase MpaA
MHISSAFECGNIRVIEVSGNSAVVEIVADPGTDYLHWFCFRSVADSGATRIFRVRNAAASRTSEGWEGYRAVASYDFQEWFRVPTSYDGDSLTIEITPARPIVYLAHFAPYTLERQGGLTAWCQQQADVAVDVLGESIEGRAIDLVTIGRAPKPLKCWITTGQHPGEPMGKWFVEGLLRRLLDSEDATALLLRQKAQFYVAPNLNPDGSFAGRLRTNVAGVDLNRAWQSPDRTSSPEIIDLRERMETTGVDFYLDAHGDETLPYCFVVASNVPSVTPRQVALRERFEAALRAANPDFQSEHGYPPERDAGDYSIANNWVSDRFDCLSMTLEQPFKDLAGSPLTHWGWSPQRSARLGAATLDALVRIIDDLR